MTATPAHVTRRALIEHGWEACDGETFGLAPGHATSVTAYTKPGAPTFVTWHIGPKRAPWHALFDGQVEMYSNREVQEIAEHGACWPGYLKERGQRPKMLTQTPEQHDAIGRAKYGPAHRPNRRPCTPAKPASRWRQLLTPWRHR